jgi:hypothetical protein
MKRNIIYNVATIIIALIALQGCNNAPKHPWTGKTFEAVSEEEGFHIRGGDPRTEGMEYIIYILKQDTINLPTKAIFITKDEHVILGVTDVGFNSEIFYVVENATDAKNNTTLQYLVKKRYFPATDTAERLEAWKYNTRKKKVERVETGDNLIFQN